VSGGRGFSRRSFVSTMISTALAAPASRALGAKDFPDEVMVETFSAAGKSTGLVHLAKVVKSDSEWLKQLTPEQFAVTRRAATEKPYSGFYWDSHDDGLYLCICCDTAAFDWSAKFSSHTGWPSFTGPNSFHNVVKSEHRRFGMPRLASACTLFDVQPGH